MQFPWLVARWEDDSGQGSEVDENALIFFFLILKFFDLVLHALRIESMHVSLPFVGRYHTVPSNSSTPSPPPPVGLLFFLCKPAGVFYFGRWVGLHLTSRISDIFTQFFTNLYTNGFKSWQGNLEPNSTWRLFNFFPSPWFFLTLKY